MVHSMKCRRKIFQSDSRTDFEPLDCSSLSSTFFFNQFINGRDNATNFSYRSVFKIKRIYSQPFSQNMKGTFQGWSQKEDPIKYQISKHNLRHRENPEMRRIWKGTCLILCWKLFGFVTRHHHHFVFETQGWPLTTSEIHSVGDLPLPCFNISRSAHLESRFIILIGDKMTMECFIFFVYEQWSKINQQ